MMRIRPWRDERLRSATIDFRFLLKRGYPRESALRFVGDHFQLHQGERDLLYRGVFTRHQARLRRAKTLSVGAIEGETLVVDGHNVLITLESALRGRALLAADDGFVRDVSRVFRRFRPTEHTKTAWTLAQGVLTDYPPGRVKVILDAPLPRSGELALRITRWMEDAGIQGTAVIKAGVESELLRQKGIKVTADSRILDRATRVFDLAGHIIRRRMRLKPKAMW